MYRKLWACDLHLAPATVDRLTMTELDLAFDGDLKPRPSDGSAPACMSQQEIDSEIARRQSMTLAERVAEAREG